MSSTNKTTNYNLSQFIGTDKPAWLSDYNGDMGKIDAGLNTAQNTATGADGKATANATAIGDLTTLTTTAKTNLVAAVNEVKTSADTALNTATNAAGTANQAQTTANALADYLTLTATPVPSANVVAQSGTVNRAELTIATNSTKTAGKVYGVLGHTPSSTGVQNITLNIDSGIHPETEFTITPAGIIGNTTPTNSQVANEVSITFKTNGNIVLQYYASYSGSRYYGILFPSLYFLSDFGDTPTPEPGA